MLDAGVRKYVVRSGAAERETLEALIRTGTHPASQSLKARILLKADVSEAGAGWSDARIAQALGTSAATIHRTRQRLVEAGLEAALRRKPRERPSITPLFDGEAEARLITLPAPRRQPGTPDGPCACWNTRWWSLASSRAPVTARSAGRSKKWHDTPKHGSWLNMAESELGVLSSQCLDRRIADKARLIREVDAWQAYRNKHHAKATWQFTRENARVMLSHLYPSLWMTQGTSSCRP